MWHGKCRNVTFEFLYQYLVYQGCGSWVVLFTLMLMLDTPKSTLGSHSNVGNRMRLGCFSSFNPSHKNWTRGACLIDFCIKQTRPFIFIYCYNLVISAWWTLCVRARILTRIHESIPAKICTIFCYTNQQWFTEYSA